MIRVQTQHAQGYPNGEMIWGIATTDSIKPSSYKTFKVMTLRGRLDGLECSWLWKISSMWTLNISPELGFHVKVPHIWGRSPTRVSLNFNPPCHVEQRAQCIGRSQFDSFPNSYSKRVSHSLLSSCDRDLDWTSLHIYKIMLHQPGIVKQGIKGALTNPRSGMEQYGKHGSLQSGTARSSSLHNVRTQHRRWAA